MTDDELAINEGFFLSEAQKVGPTPNDLHVITV